MSPKEGLTRKTVYDNLILVGDSAGQANPLVLEGIRYAIRFGEIAGKVAAAAIKIEDTSEKSLMPYEKEWRKAIESKINSAIKVQNRWVGLTDEEWDKELCIINELSADEAYINMLRVEKLEEDALAKAARAAAHNGNAGTTTIIEGAKAVDARTENHSHTSTHMFHPNPTLAKAMLAN